MEINYRNMKIEDYPKVWDLWMSSKNMGFNDKDDSEEGIARYLKRNPTSSFIATCEDRVVGVILSGHDGRRGFIHHMAVAEDFRRQGIASTLVSMALDALKAEGINKVACVVFKYNDNGNPFWEAQGFTCREDLNYRNKALVNLTRIDT